MTGPPDVRTMRSASSMRAASILGFGIIGAPISAVGCDNSRSRGHLVTVPILASRSRRSKWVVHILAVTLLAGCTQTAMSADVPPVGEMWFGSSFDTATFEVQGRTETVGATEPFAGVAHIPDVMDASDLAMRIYWNGELVNSTGANATGSGDLWGWTLGPLFEPGTWRYEVTDIGGNVLASGEVNAEE